MEVFRLSRKKHGTALSGKGASAAGGRWNSKGVEIIYTATSRALAVAEVVVHLDVSNLPKDFMMLQIFIPDDSPIQTVVPSQLPDSWNCFPPSLATQYVGNQFIENREFLLTKVPSAVIRGDYNLLINPSHALFRTIRILSAENFMMDNRFFF